MILFDQRLSSAVASLSLLVALFTMSTLLEAQTAGPPKNSTSSVSEHKQPETLHTPVNSLSVGKPYDIWTTRRLTGDWSGVRTEWEDAGITLKLNSQTQFMINMHGGLETKNGHDFATSYDLDLELDFGKMNFLPGGTFFFRAKGTSGGDASDFDKEKIGGLFKTNGDGSIEEPLFVDKWWWRQRLMDDRIEFRLGHIDSKKDIFDVNKVAGSEDKYFLNSALVVNPTIPHKNGLGAYINVWPTDWLFIRAAIIDPESRARRT